MCGILVYIAAVDHLTDEAHQFKFQDLRRVNGLRGAQLLVS